MAKGGRGGRRSGAPTNVQVTSGASGGNVPVNVSAFTDADAQQLRDDMEDMYDPDVTDAIKLYISDSNPNGDGFSHAQNLNYKLDNDIALNATEKFIDDNIQAGMHAIGKDTMLVRYAHDDILKAMGVSDYTKMTDAQLQNALVGTTFKTTSYTSTSYDAKKSPFAPDQPAGGGREVVINFKAGKNTKVVFGAKKQAEMVLNKGTQLKVTGIHFDGTYATPRNKGTRPRVVLEVETY
jgi:hypothetical protein